MWQILRRILSKAKPSELGAIAKRLSEVTGRQVSATKASILEATLAARDPKTRRMILTVVAGSVVAGGVTGAVINDISDGVLLDDKGFTEPYIESGQDLVGVSGGVSNEIVAQYAAMTGENVRRITGDGEGDTVWGQDPTSFATAIQQQLIANGVINKTLRTTGMSLEALKNLRNFLFRLEDEHIEAYRMMKSS